jgi:pyruvate dehydrogenase E2 component (dihydrolipoamide acetyltransferase)
MAFRVILPKLGPGIKDAQIITWLKQEGDWVEKGEPFVEIETSKAIFELEAEESGILRKIFAMPGDKIVSNATIAIVGEDKEDIENLINQIEEEKIQVVQAEEQSSDEKVVTASLESKSPKFEKEIAKLPTIKASPAAKRLAKKKGISLELIAAEFEYRVITKEDVLAFIERKR